MASVTEHLSDCDFAFERLDHRPAGSAREEADALGVPLGEIAKAVAINTAHGITVCVLAGDRRINLERLRARLDDDTVEIATEADIRAAFMEFDLGALPPLGGLLAVPTFVDRALLEHDTIVFASGTRRGSVRLHSRDLLEEPYTWVLPLSDE